MAPRLIGLVRPDGAYKTWREVEGEYLTAVIQAADGCLSDAARAIGMHRRTLQRKLRPRVRKRRGRK